MGDLRRLIAFDLDGTLIDSRRDLTDSANQLLTELGGRPLSEEAIGRMIGEGARLLVQRTLAASGLENGPGTLARFLEIYDTRLLNHTRPYDGIVDVVRLAGQHARVVVLTNKGARPSERLLEGLGMRDLFEEVVGGDGPLPRKPDPSGLLALMDRAGASAPHTLLIGDSPIDHETARRAGVRCCLAAYGFGFERFPADRPPADEWVVRAPAGLIDVIERFVGTPRRA
ncbi:MAG: HAD-IA family hydrolase [Acidobacteria bacterium]|nr:HAD-IA family hydrolase [Acidobacteriota bacterium]